MFRLVFAVFFCVQFATMAYAAEAPTYGTVLAPSYGLVPLSVEQPPHGDPEPQPSYQVVEDVDDDSRAELERQIESALQNNETLLRLIQKKSAMLLFLNIPITPIRSRLAQQRVALETINEKLGAEDELDVGSIKDQLDSFGVSDLEPTLQALESAHAAIKKTANREVKKLLFEPLKSIKKSLLSGDFGSARVAAERYAAAVQKNKKIILGKKLSKAAKKQIRNAMSNPNGDANNHTATDNKKADTGVDRFNTAMQKSIQFDAMLKSINLGSGIR